MTVLYCIGDIHGRLDLLDDLADSIAETHALLHNGKPAEIICLGDYIDGGGQSAGVLDRLRKGLKGFPTTCILGNHDSMMLDCTTTDDPKTWQDWISNGGDTTLESFGVSTECDPTALSKALGSECIEWLRNLPIYLKRKTYLFVHAGIVPSVPLEDQNTYDMLWIRGRFLDSDADHGFRVIHGHTPGDEPIVKPNRICVDTGAASSGTLTAAVLSDDPMMFLRATGPAGCGP